MLKMECREQSTEGEVQSGTNLFNENGDLRKVGHDLAIDS
jgi:hypothetical protein